MSSQSVDDSIFLFEFVDSRKLLANLHHCIRFLIQIIRLSYLGSS